MTVREAMIVVDVPPQVYVNVGLVPASVHGTEHLSMTICRPATASLSSTEVGLAVVVIAIAARSLPPVLARSNERWIVSPATTPVALTVNRLVDAPVAPNAIVTLADVTDCDADVVDVNVAYVPMPAAAAATPRTTSVQSSLCDRKRRRVRPV